MYLGRTRSSPRVLRLAYRGNHFESIWNFHLATICSPQLSNQTHATAASASCIRHRRLELRHSTHMSQLYDLLELNRRFNSSRGDPEVARAAGLSTG